jgi:FkbM family methyltransferase
MSQKPIVSRIFNLVSRRLRAAWRGLTDPFARVAYSQEGEDLILERIFERQPSGFYVDVGAHHPTRFSNTYIFYLRGWSGVNIDAAPGSMKPFRATRPRDANIEAIIGSGREQVTFYIYKEPALNSTLPPEQRGIDPTKYPVARQVRLTSRPLAEILAETVPPGQVIDFLTIDVEGMDLQVLRSNDWSRFRPKYVLAEEMKASGNGSVTEYMATNGYSVYCRTMNTIFFGDNQNKTRA